MHIGTYVFAQVMEHVPRYDFDRCVARYGGERYAKTFSCRDQFFAMASGQFAYRESLRDVVTCLSSHRQKLYHLGFRSLVAKTTLARANESRDWRIWRDLAEALITKARALYFDEPAIADGIDSSCHAIDSTSIELCLAIFPHFPYVATKASVKLHLGLDIRGSIPAFFDMTSDKTSDVQFLDQLVFEAGAFYIVDRGYLDFSRLHRIHGSGAFFVTHARRNSRMARRYSNPVDKTTGVLADQIVFLTDADTRKNIPTRFAASSTAIRTGGRTCSSRTTRVRSPLRSPFLYKYRWQIELFFK